MTKQEFIDEKKQKISELNKAQEKICKDIEDISKRPYVDFQTAVKNATQVVQWVVMVRSLEAQKQIIIARPFPKNPSGGANNMLAIVGESVDNEIIQVPV